MEFALRVSIALKAYNQSKARKLRVATHWNFWCMHSDRLQRRRPGLVVGHFKQDEESLLDRALLPRIQPHNNSYS